MKRQFLYFHLLLCLSAFPVSAHSGVRNIFDDFDPDIDQSQWTGFGGTVTATNHAGSVSGANSLKFSGSGDRFAETAEVDTRVGGELRFHIRLGNGLPNFDTAELPGDGIVLEYADEANTNWMELARFETIEFREWTLFTTNFPANLGNEATRFRWRQPNHAGGNSDLWALDDVSYAAFSGPPAILVQPQSVTELLDSPASLNVFAGGEQPLAFQWNQDGAPIAGATNDTLHFTSLAVSNGGTYTVTVSNNAGSTNSQAAVLTVVAPSPFTFKVQAFTANNSMVVDVGGVTGDDRGGIALAGTNVFRTGDSATARFNAADLSDGVSIGRVADGLVSDLRSGRIFALANGTNELNSSGGVLDSLLEQDETGLPTGRRIPLSRSLSLPSSNVGIFSGWARVVMFVSDTVYEINLPSGHVRELGSFSRPAWEASESFSIWGVAEHFLGQDYLRFVNSAGNGIVRKRISDGEETIPDTFSNLGQTHSMIVSPTRNRWYFTHESSSQFGGSSETLGFADASMTFKSDSFAPIIDVQPASQRRLAGRSAVLRVQAIGSGTLAYQWMRNGTAVSDATNAVLILPAVQPGDAGDYTVSISNSVGSVTSSIGTLTVLPARADRFKILGLGTNNLQTVEINTHTGDDRGGLVLSTTNVLVNGDTRVASFSAADLSNPVNADRRIDGLCSDLQTRTIYSLSDGTNELVSSQGTLRELVELKGSDAMPTGSSVVLRTPITLPAGRVGIFSGWGRIMIYAGGRVYEILLPSGDVTDFGAMTEPAWSSAEIGDVFGVAENFDGSLHLAYSRLANESIERVRVPDGMTEVVAQFTNLGDLGNFAVSHADRRWYFSYESTSQFGTGSETLGFADAFLDVETSPQGPGILVHPDSATAMEGGIVDFSVQAVGVGTLFYQWSFNGSPISGATNSQLFLSGLMAGNAGNYTVAISNSIGMVTSTAASLTVQPLQADTFHILSFGTNNSMAINASSPAGDDRGGMALSSNRVFHNGDSTAAIYDLGLTNGLAVGRTIDGLCYDIQTMTPYALGNGTNALTSSGGVLNALIELAPDTGDPTGRLIRLSQPISMSSSGNGIFSGYGRLIIYAGGRFYDIGLPSGIVTDLGAMTRPSWQTAEIWSTWGIAEKFLGALHVVYHRTSSEEMVRTRIPDGATSVISTFTEITDLASFAVHPGLQRWYFHYEGLGQFFPSSTEVLGYAEIGLNRQTATIAPVITRQPSSRTQLAPRETRFSVQAFGTPPLSYQWQSNGVALAGATEAVFVIPSVRVEDAANYSVVVSNAQGSVTSSIATLTVLPPRNDFFKINTLLADNVRVAEVNTPVGDDRAGIAVSGTNVFVTGDTETHLFERTALTNTADLNRRVEGLVSDLRTGKVYALANGTTEVTSTGSTVDTLIELDPSTGNAIGNNIALSQGISWTFTSSGVFSGFGRFILYNDGRVYEILLPEGVVFDHGPMTRPSWATTEFGPAWGVTESFEGDLTLVYSVTSNETIERIRVSNGAKETVARFNNLGDIAAITLSLDQQRWYFRHESTSQFSTHLETIGYADAELSFFGAPPVIGIFDNAQFVDTDNTPTAESDNVQATVGALNFLGRTYDSISLATLRRDVLIIPDLEKGSPISSGQIPGPVILGGDDLTDHGSVDASGNTRLGWLYIQNAIANLNRDQTREGPFTVDIAALGSAQSTSTSANGGGAIGAAAAALGLTVDYYDGATAIQGFFDTLRTNGTNPKILWLAGTDTSNDLDPNEGGVLVSNAGLIAQFVAEGGGLMSHGGDDGNTAYGWLNTLFPQVIQTPSGTSGGHRLTDLGRATFPLLTDANIDSGPSHNWFGGDISAFDVLGLDANDRPFILGGRGGSAFNNRQALINMVSGGGVLIVHGSPGTPTNALTFLNELLGSTLTGSPIGAGSMFGRTAAADGTTFGDDPANLAANNDTLTLDTSSLPAGSASLYEANGRTLVATFDQGAGKIVFLGWDWNDAQPAGTQLGGWANVMESAIALKGTNTVVPPIITVQPRDTSITEGGAVSLNVLAVGTPPLQFQWRLNGTNIAGATSATLVVSGVSTNDAGAYDVVITNAAGTTTSRQATLTVLPAIDQFVFDPIASPKYTNLPFEVTVRAVDGASNVVHLFNSTVSFSSSVTVFPMVSGVFTNGIWRGLIMITNEATGVTLSVDDGSGNTGTSGSFDVTQPLLSITQHPQGVIANFGDTITLTVAGTGSINPVNYQWLRGGAPLPGATQNMLVLSNANRASGGIYSAVVSDTGGSLMSSNAIVRVRVPQLVQHPLLLGNGTLRLRFGDQDGGLLGPGDLMHFRVDGTTNLINWQRLTNSLVLTNGMIELIDAEAAGLAHRFYRVLEDLP